MNADGAYANLVLPALLRERRLTGRDAASPPSCWPGPVAGRAATTRSSLQRPAGRAQASFSQPYVDLLRLGAHQILVNAGSDAGRRSQHRVDLAAATVGERVTGLVNAVLRRIAERSLRRVAGPAV